MRKLTWLAAAAFLAAATPAIALASTTPPATSDTGDSKITTTIKAALAKLDAGDVKGAEKDLAALVNDPALAAAPPLNRSQALFLLGLCERLDEHPEAALKHFAAAGDAYPDLRNQAYWIEVARANYSLEHYAEVGDALANAVTVDPEDANDVSTEFLWVALRELKKLKDGGAHRRQLLEALYQAHYDPNAAPTAGEAMRVDLFELYAEAGEDAKARAMLPTFATPDSVVALRADNRYRRLVVDDPDFKDFAAIQDNNIRHLRNRQAAGSLPVSEALAQALMTANRLPEAMDVVENALRIGDLAPQTGDDEGDTTKWLLDTRTRILEKMGRWDEVEAAQVKARDAALKEGVDLVSQKINLADLYNRLGRPQDALKELGDLHNDGASVYGQMVAEQVRACAYAVLGDKDRLKASLDLMRTHNSEAPGLLATALTCAGDEDGAAALLIARLDDPEQRTGELVSDQDYLPAPHPTVFDQKVDVHVKNILKRPDVRAAIAKYGVIESYPAFSPEN